MAARECKQAAGAADMTFASACVRAPDQRMSDTSRTEGVRVSVGSDVRQRVRHKVMRTSEPGYVLLVKGFARNRARS